MYISCPAHTRGKAVVSLAKIAIFQDLGTSATRKHNGSVELGEKLALVFQIEEHDPRASQRVPFSHAHKGGSTDFAMCVHSTEL